MSESQTARILAVLEDGQPHTVPEIHERAGTSRLNSRISDLRKKGYTIVCSRIKGKVGAAAYQYQMFESEDEAAFEFYEQPENREPVPGSAPTQLTLDGDVIAPRTERERYRIYRTRDGGALELMATCKSREAVGVTVCTLGDEGEFLDYCVGVMDGMDHQNEKGEWIGKWLILPWQAKEIPDDL